jgi:hypothetical protein
MLFKSWRRLSGATTRNKVEIERCFTSALSLEIVRKFIGFSLIFAGLIAGLVCGIAIIDPVGTKQSDDADPFGTPPSRAESAVGLVGSAIAGGFGFVLLCRTQKASRPETSDGVSH